MEILTSIVPEKTAEDSSFHFEAGEHVYLQSEYNEDTQQIANGHLDTHWWHGKGLQERIAKYGFDAPALILGIDSLEPQVFYNDKAMDWRTLAWYELPARPNELHHTGKVLIARFDILGDHMEQSAMWTGKVEQIPQNIINQENQYTNTRSLEVSSDYDNTLLREDIAVVGFGTLLWALMRHGIPQTKKTAVASFDAPDNPLLAKREISRRELLKRGIQYTTAATVGTWLLNQGRHEITNLANFTSDEPTEQFLLTIDNILKPHLSDPVFLDGRTARGVRAIPPLAAMLSLPNGTQSSVLLGWKHAARAEEFIDNDEEADKAIAAFAEELLTVAKNIYAQYYKISPQRIPETFTTNFLDYFTTLDLLAVTDPGGSAVQPNFANTLPRNVTASRPFASPQLENAIKHLRSPQNQPPHRGINQS